MIRHQHYATMEIYVEGVQRLIEGAEDAVTTKHVGCVERMRQALEAMVQEA